MAEGIRTLEELEEMVNDYFEFDEFVFDVETIGEGDLRKNPHRNDVFWISLAGPGRADVIPCGHPVGERVIYEYTDEKHRIKPNSKTHQERRINPDSGREKWFDIPEPFTPAPKQLWVSEVMEALRPLLFSGRRKIGHNVKFDLISVSKYYGGAVPPGPYGDTIVAAKLVNENFPDFRLGHVIKREFGFEYEKIGKQVEKYPYSEALLYSYLDSKYTWLLWCKMVPLLEKQNVRHIFDMEMELLPVIIDMEKAGTPVDESVLDVLDKEFTKELATLQVAINSVAGKEVNLNADRQVADLVYGTLGKTCTVFTSKTQQPSTSKETLEAFKKNKTVRNILQHAQIHKLKSTFVDGLRRNLFDGRVHPSFNQVGAVSGRVSCSEPNIQQIPVRSERGKRIREVFAADAGKVFVVVDLSQIELRMLAHYTQDPVLLKAYRQNLDLHGLLAARVFGKDYTPTDRLYAKNGNFSVLFGAQASTLVRKYGFPNIKLAKEVLEGFYSTYKRVSPWKDEVIALARSRYKKRKSPAYVTTILGRKRRLPALYYLDRGERAAAERQAISVTISGSAADYFKLAMIQVDQMLKDQDFESHILMQVHDELVVEVDEANADTAMAVVKAGMENITNPFTQEPILSVPVIADAKIVHVWADAK